MLRDFLIKLQSQFVDGEEVAAYRPTLPTKVTISYKKDGSYFIAYIEDIDGNKIPGLLITQGKTPNEMVSNINQLVYSYIKMPEKIRPYYGDMFKFPVKELKQSGELTLQKA